MDDVKRLDVVDVIRKRLQEIGMVNVIPYFANLNAADNVTVVRLDASAGASDVYFDMSFDSSLNLTVYVLRTQEVESMVDARQIEYRLRNSSLDSENGSYTFTRIETTLPHPLLWDDTGRDVWVVEATIHIQMEE